MSDYIFPTAEQCSEGEAVHNNAQLSLSIRKWKITKSKKQKWQCLACLALLSQTAWDI